MIDSWVEAAAQGRTNIAPAKIPWDLIRTLITETYGGKIDDEADFTHLSNLVTKFLTPAAFDDEHRLVVGAQGAEADAYTEGDGSLIVPSGTGMSDFMEWVDRLP